MIEKIDIRKNKKIIDEIINMHVQKNWYLETDCTQDPIISGEASASYTIRTDKTDLRSRFLSINAYYTGKQLTIRVLDAKQSTLADKIAEDYQKSFPKSQVTILL